MGQINTCPMDLFLVSVAEVSKDTLMMGLENGLERKYMFHMMILKEGK